MQLNQRNIVFTDLETTGLDFMVHEIIEIGAVITNSELQVIDEIDIKVAPEHLETASPESIEFVGYSDHGWAQAMGLKQALEIYADKTAGAIFATHNPTFDWPFLHKSFADHKVSHTLDYHRIDTFSIAWQALGSELKDFGEEGIAKYFGIEPEPIPHRAINGARLSYEIYKKLMLLG